MVYTFRGETMKNKIIIVVSIILIILCTIVVVITVNKNNDVSDSPVYTTQEDAVVNRDAIIVTTEEQPDFVDPYVFEDYQNISWEIGKDVINPDIEELYTYLSNSSDIDNIDDVYSVEVYNSSDTSYRYYLSVKEAGSIKSIYVP